jgi:hypothetical protein
MHHSLVHLTALTKIKLKSSNIHISNMSNASINVNISNMFGEVINGSVNVGEEEMANLTETANGADCQTTQQKKN